MLVLQVFSLVILNLRCQRFNIYRHSRGFSKANVLGSSQVPRDASAVAVPGFSCFSGPEASDVSKEIGTKMPFFQVPSSGNDSAEMVKLQNPLFQRAFKKDPHFETQVKALELMLKVRDRVADRTSAAVSGASSGECGLESSLSCLRFLLEALALVITVRVLVNFLVLGLMGAPTRRLLRLLVVSLLGARELLKDSVILLLYLEPLNSFVRLRLPLWQQLQVIA